MVNRLRNMTTVWVAAVLAGGVLAGGVVNGQAAKGKAESPAGAWQGTAETPDGPQAFGLTLTVDGEKVSGEIALTEGTVKLTSGSWTKGELALAFDHPAAGPITLSGAFKEGKLAGTYAIGNGGGGGGWQAERKAAK
jgi:hypothetical protein